MVPTEKLVRLKKGVYWVVLFVGFSVAALLGQEFTKGYFRKQEDEKLQSALKETLSAIALPSKITDDLLLVKYLVTRRRVTFYYVYSGFLTSDFRQRAYGGALQICSDQSVRSLFEHGVSYAYVYRSGDGRLITEFEVDANSCRANGGLK
jgi:hypothetical protein